MIEHKELVDCMIRDKRVRGIAFLLIQNNDQFIYTSGFENNEKSKIIDEGSIFEIASLSKVFTGILFADFFNNDLIDPESPLSDFLPDIGLSSSITISELLTHTSGLPRIPNNINPANLANPYVDYTKVLLLNELKYSDLRDKGKYCYSNLGYAVLGMVLETVTNKTYDENLKTIILEKLNMRDTFVKNLSGKVYKGSNTKLEDQPNWEMGIFEAAGGIKSTINDMCNFAKAVINANDEKTSIDKAIIRSMKCKFINDDLGVGLGWHIFGHEPHFSHDGATYGFYAKIRIFTKTKQGMILLTNTFCNLSEFDDLIGTYQSR